MNELKAGRELDALVAEKIFGWQRWTCQDLGFKEAILMEPGVDLRASWRKCGGDTPLGNGGGAITPHYSTDLQDAWLIVKRLSRPFRLTAVADTCYAVFCDEHGENEARSGFCETPAEAICLAALRALEAEWTK